MNWNRWDNAQPKISRFYGFIIILVIQMCGWMLLMEVEYEQYAAGECVVQ